MIKVWVLIAYMWTGNAGGPLVIDNIASQQECERVAENIRYMTRDTLLNGTPTRCVEVWKIK